MILLAVGRGHRRQGVRAAHRPQDGLGAAVEQPAHHRRFLGWRALVVGLDDVELAAKDAAGRIDLVNGDLHTHVVRREGRGDQARHGACRADLEAVAALGQGQAGVAQQQAAADAQHLASRVGSGKGRAGHDCHQCPRLQRRGKSNHIESAPAY